MCVKKASRDIKDTNWQGYVGEVGATPLTQTLGRTVQKFASAAVGLAFAVALVWGVPALRVKRG